MKIFITIPSIYQTAAPDPSVDYIETNEKFNNILIEQVQALYPGSTVSVENNDNLMKGVITTDPPGMIYSSDTPIWDIVQDIYNRADFWEIVDA